MQESRDAVDELKKDMILVELVQALQKERGLTTLYLSTTDPDQQVRQFVTRGTHRTF